MKTKENRGIFYITWGCVIVTIILIIFTLVRSIRPSQGKPFERLSVEEARQYMSYEASYQVLDVRDIEAYDEGHLKGAVHVAYDSLVQDADLVLEDRSQMVYVYGQSSEQSCAAAQKLSDMGYTSVAEIGTYEEWITLETETETEGILRNVLG